MVNVTITDIKNQSKPVRAGKFTILRVAYHGLCLQYQSGKYHIFVIYMDQPILLSKHGGNGINNFNIIVLYLTVIWRSGMENFGDFILMHSYMPA